MPDDKRPVGTIKINEVRQSLDARCNKCKAKVNRQYTPRFRRDKTPFGPYGRPVGLLVAWLRKPCSGNRSDHVALLDSCNVEERILGRAWAASQDDPIVVRVLSKECSPRTSENDEPEGQRQQRAVRQRTSAQPGWWDFQERFPRPLDHQNAKNHLAANVHPTHSTGPPQLVSSSALVVS